MLIFINYGESHILRFAQNLKMADILRFLTNFGFFKTFDHLERSKLLRQAKSVRSLLGISTLLLSQIYIWKTEYLSLKNHAIHRDTQKAEFKANFLVNATTPGQLSEPDPRDWIVAACNSNQDDLNH